MWGSSLAWEASSSLLAALLLLSLLQNDLVTGQKHKHSAWPTLSGSAPAIIARGGFSGLFPDSSLYAYALAQQASMDDTTLWCDVQLTKDSVGICLPDVKIDNCTDIAYLFSSKKKVYNVNGVKTEGWFSVDYSFSDLSQVHLVQGIYSRTEKFDGSYNILAVEDVASQFKQSSLWLNIQHDLFYMQHKLSMRSYVLQVSKSVVISYISSPEVAFLSSIAARFRGSETKLVFRFLDKDITEPSTNQKYGSLLKNLTFIKTFASGVLVPKKYIWRVTSDLYLQPYTSIVMDAHKEGLEIYASDFANDAIIPYNYSYDPLAEYLHFIDNGVFSVDGVVTDFPITPSAAVGCFSHIGKNNSKLERLSVISHNGASGVYPDCTDLAYEQAIKDRADFIDCPVQVTKDEILICMSSIDLIGDTTVTTSPFRSRISIIPDIKKGPGIFTFNLTWEEIQKNLRPAISIPDPQYPLVRNPRYKNAGKYMTLSDFLAFAKKKTSGILISIENAVFLAEKLGYSITDNVMSALNGVGYNDQSAQVVWIQSSNSSVLIKFKQQTNYKRVYKIDEFIRDAVASSIADIKDFAHSVAINKDSIYPQNEGFTTGQTGLVNKLQAAGLSVFVYLLRNEFITQAWDFFSDPTVEINTFVQGAGVDGIITDFPKTSARYKRNKCSKFGNNVPRYFSTVQPGSLLQLIASPSLPPAEAPWPILNVSDVVEPPLPPVTSSKPLPPPNSGNPQPPTALPSTGAHCTAASMLLLSLAMFLGVLLVT